MKVSPNSSNEPEARALAPISIGAVAKPLFRRLAVLAIALLCASAIDLRAQEAPSDTVAAFRAAEQSGAVAIRSDGTSVAEGIAQDAANPQALDQTCAPGPWATSTVGPSARYRAGSASEGGSIYVFGGGTSAGGFLNDAWRWNAATQTWTQLANMPTAKQNIQGAHWNGKIYVPGGFVTGSVHTTENAIYDIASNTWSVGAPLPAAQSGQVVAYNGKIYVFAGNPGPVATTRIYDIATNTWSTGASMPVTITYGRAVVAGNFAYYVGGIAAGTTTTNTVYRYDFAANSWATMAPLQTARTSAELMAPPGSNKIFAVGGGGAGFFTAVPQAQSVEIYDVPTNTWSYGNPLVQQVAAPAGGFAGEKLMVQGGVDVSSYFNNVQVSTAPCTPALACTGYNAVTSMGNGIVPGTTDTGNNCDDCATPITFPFPVNVYGVQYTTGAVTSNGSIVLTNTAAPFGPLCPLPNAALGTALLVYQGDLRTDSNATDGIFTSVTGTAPNRVFHIEWRTTYFNRAGTANFEARFFEATGEFAFVYGATADNGSLESSGVQEASSGRATTFSCSQATLPPGLMVHYRCPDGPCNDYTITPSRRPLVPGTTDTGNHCDDCTTPVTLPFPVSLYGTSFTSANVSSNGNLQFNSNLATFTNTNLPGANFNASIFPFWDDMLTSTAGSGIFTSVTGTAPNRQLNVEWRATSFSSAAATANFEVQFTEGSPHFELIYGATASPAAFSGTIGVQQTGGTLATQAAGPAATPPPAGTRLLFTRGCCPAVGFTGTLGSNSPGYPGASGMQAGRVTRAGNALASRCGTTRAYPGTSDTAPRAYDAYTFINNGPATCVTFSVNTACTGTNFIFPVAYLGSFNPNNLAENYLGDPGGSPNPYGTFSVNVPANATVVLVVGEVTAGTGCPSYDVTVQGLGCQALTLTSAASRKTHPGAGTFDVPLPLTGEPGVECRANAGNHTLVFNFNTLVTSAAVRRISGIGTVGTPSFNGQTMTVPLTGVTDVQQFVLSLDAVESAAGEVLPNTLVRMNVLLGDTTGNKTVNASDVSQTKSQSGQPVTATNFRTDTNVSGSINASDVSQVKANAGRTLP